MVFLYFRITLYPLWLSLLGHLVLSIVRLMLILLYLYDIPMILYVLHVILIRCLLYTEVSLAVIKPLMIRPFLLFSVGRLSFFFKPYTFWGESCVYLQYLYRYEYRVGRQSIAVRVE